MTLDRRQLVLGRLADILRPLAPNFWHNRGELENDKRPAIILLDADEIADPKPFNAQKRGLAQSANRMLLSPQIIVALKDAKPFNENVGTDLSTFRMNILDAVLNEPLFQNGDNTLIGTSGELQYHGASTDLARQLDMNGEMFVMFTFVYPFIPAEIKKG